MIEISEYSRETREMKESIGGLILRKGLIWENN